MTKDFIDLPEGYSELLIASSRLREAVRERADYTKKLQEVASEARRTGKPGRVPNYPSVFSIDDEIYAVCEAVDNIRKIGKRGTRS